MPATPPRTPTSAATTTQDTLQMLRAQRVTTPRSTAPRALGVPSLYPTAATSTFATLVARASAPSTAAAATVTTEPLPPPRPTTSARRACLELQEPDDVPIFASEEESSNSRRPTTQAEAHEFNQKLYWKKAALKLEINKIPLIAKVEMHLSSQHMRWIVRQSLQLDTSAKRIATWQSYMCWWGEGVQNFNHWVLHLPQLHTYAAKMKALSVHPETLLRLDELDAKLTSGEPMSLTWFAILYVAGPILLAIGLRIIIFVFGERLGILGSAFEMYVMGQMGQGPAAAPAAAGSASSSEVATGNTNDVVSKVTGMVQQFMGIFNGSTPPTAAAAVGSPHPGLPTGGDSIVAPSSINPVPLQPASPVRTRRYQSQFVTANVQPES